MAENCTNRFAFHTNLNTLVIHGRCAGDPPEQIAERCHLQPATTSAAYENQALLKELNCSQFFFLIFKSTSTKEVHLDKISTWAK